MAKSLTKFSGSRIWARPFGLPPGFHPASLPRDIALADREAPTHSREASHAH